MGEKKVVLEAGSVCACVCVREGEYTVKSLMRYHGLNSSP